MTWADFGGNGQAGGWNEQQLTYYALHGSSLVSNYKAVNALPRNISVGAPDPNSV
jgi:hypothetical protein